MVSHSDLKLEVDLQMLYLSSQIPFGNTQENVESLPEAVHERVVMESLVCGLDN